MAAIRVLVVEDSQTQRYQLVSLIEKTPDLKVIGQAHNGLEAVQLVERLRPDVISMDIRMPHLSGLEATRQIMAHFPTPIVIVSHAYSEAELAMQAMQAGALAVIEKPPASNHPTFDQRCTELVSMLRLMAGVRVIRHWNYRDSNPDGKPPITTGILRSSTAALTQARGLTGTPEVVAIGASAGGPGALLAVLSSLPIDFPLPVLVVQHLSPDFMAGLSHWLNHSCRIPVRLAQSGEHLKPGEVLLSPGGVHMGVSEDKRIMLDSRRGMYRHQPAVDVLLTSVAQRYATRAIGVVLTGMGNDGAHGLLAMRNAGAHTIVQDEATSAVFGMPAACIALDAAQLVLPLEKIGPAIKMLSERGERSANGTNSLAR
jgi:two-component system, chemotaxis family, protein-glutamate methylesterase/glutaminase